MDNIGERVRLGTAPLGYQPADRETDGGMSLAPKGFGAAVISARQKDIATAYIRRIRNTNKREYASNYLNWILDGRQGAEPDRRYLLNGTLSYMAAQAVRTELDRIMGGQHE